MLKRCPSAIRPATDRHPSLLGADRQLLRHRARATTIWLDPFIGASLIPAATRRVPRHDRHPLRASGLDRRELHRLRHRATRSAPTAPFRVWSTASARCSKPRSSTRQSAAATPTKYLRALDARRGAEVARRSSGRRREGVDVRPLIDRAIADVRSPKPRPRSARTLDHGVRAGSRRSSALSTSPSPSPTGPPAKRNSGHRRTALDHRQPAHLQRLLACVDVCNDDALRPVTQTAGNRRRTSTSDWDFWLDLPTTPTEFIRIENLDEQDRRAGNAAARQDQLQRDGLRRRRVPRLRREDRRSICSPRTVEALMQPRVAKQVVARSTT